MSASTTTETTYQHLEPGPGRTTASFRSRVDGSAPQWFTSGSTAPIR